MTRLSALIALIPLAYLIGSIPFGLIVGLAKGIDPRKAGSGNIGATNIGRLLGGKYFALVLALDALKSLLPTLAAGALLRFSADGRLDCLLWILIGFAAVCGHMFSLFLGFKGGKGVATSAGATLGIFPYCTFAALIAAGVFILTFKLTRFVSVASMIGSIAFPLAYAAIGLARHWPILGAQLPLLMFAVAVPVLIILRHRGNIARLLAGTENRIAEKVS